MNFQRFLTWLIVYLMSACVAIGIVVSALRVIKYFRV